MAKKSKIRLRAGSTIGAPAAEEDAEYLRECFVDLPLIAAVSPATLKRCSARGELQILKLSPRRVGIRLSRLNAWLDSRAAS